MESGSHRIVLSTRVTCFTLKLYLHTEVVHVHTRNKFIHTEIEQTIPYSIHITLHQVISYSKLPPLTHTNGTDTHEESGRNPRNWEFRHATRILDVIMLKYPLKVRPIPVIWVQSVPVTAIPWGGMNTEQRNTLQRSVRQDD